VRRLQAELALSRAELQLSHERLEYSQMLLWQAREALTLNYSDYHAQIEQAKQLGAARAETVAAQARIAALTAELQAVQSSLTQTQAQLAEYIPLKDKHAQDLATLQALHAESARLDEMKDAAESRHESCQDELSAQQADLDTLHSDHAAIQRSLTDAQAERDRLQRELHASTVELQARQGALVRANKAESAAIERSNALQAQLATVQAKLNKAETPQADAAEVTTTALVEQLEISKAALDAELAAKTAMQQALAEALSNRERLLKQLDSLKARGDGAQSQERQSQDEVQRQLLACNERLVAAKMVISASNSGSILAAIEHPSNEADSQKVEMAALESAAQQSAQADGDADGVSDAKDLCPKSPAAAAVNSLGCAPDAPIALDDIHFRYDSDALTGPSRTTLDQVAVILRAQPGLKVEIAGHSDTQGDADYNLWLSEQRAKSVMAYLVMQGVPADLLSARGYGGTQPIAENTTREGLARNRRVELRGLH
jgi:outer membrane protein OmpA-like peptidoglycan-associated protein